MRWVFTFIVIINAVAFWWYSSQPQSDTTAGNEINSAELKNIPSLILLSERPKLPSEIAQEKLAGAQDDAEVSDEDAAAAVSTSDIDEGSLSEMQESGDVQVSTQGQSTGSGEVAAITTVENPQPSDAPPICIELGPFSEVISARQVKLRLSSLDMSAEVETRKIELEPVYWVYLEPRENRGGALALLRELQNKRIDSFLISEGEFANGISLGFFRQKSSAEELQQERLEQGYDAKIRIKERYKDRFWLSLPAESATKFSDSLMTNLLSEYNYLQKKENSCDRVASTPNFE